MLGANRRVLGDERRSTLTTVCNLPSSLQYQGKHAEAERIEREVVDASRRVLGEEHPDARISAYNLARPLWDQGKHVQAEEMLQTALQDQQHALGSAHPALRGTLSLSLQRAFCPLQRAALTVAARSAA